MPGSSAPAGLIAYIVRLIAGGLCGSRWIGAEGTLFEASPGKMRVILQLGHPAKNKEPELPLTA